MFVVIVDVVGYLRSVIVDVERVGHEGDVDDDLLFFHREEDGSVVTSARQLDQKRINSPNDVDDSTLP